MTEAAMASSDTQFTTGIHIPSFSKKAYSEYYAKKSTELLMKQVYLAGCVEDRMKEILRAVNGALGHSRFPTFTIFGSNQYRVISAECLYDSHYNFFSIQGKMVDVGDVKHQEPQLELAYRNHDCILQLCTTDDEVQRYIEAFNRSECLPPNLISPHLTTLLLEMNSLLRQIRDITSGLNGMEQALHIICDNKP